MGYYLTEDLAQTVSDDVATMVTEMLQEGSLATIVVADLSYRANWDEDKKVEAASGESPLVLLERTYGEPDADLQAEQEEMVETALTMMDREGVSLDALFTELRQNIEEGDLYPSSEVVGLVAGHLAIAVAGLDQDGNARIMNEFRDRILLAIADELTQDDKGSESNYVGEEEDEDAPKGDASA
jgi:hypothetical protein